MNVVLCDDHRLFTETLSVVLEARGHSVVARALHPDDAVAAVREHKVDVCLMDLSFPNGDGMEGARGVITASPGTKVVMLTASSEPSIIEEAVASGARGFAIKGDNLEAILETIERVHNGTVVIGERAFRGLGPRTDEHRSPEQRLAQFLTGREREVLERLVRGESTHLIADEMKVAYSTARTHIQNILTKLGVHSKLEAVAFAARNSLVSVPQRGRAASGRR